MTGQGTAENPYLCTNVYDFCSIGEYDGTESSLTYVKLANNIDFNDHDTYKLGITGTVINAPYTVIDGDGRNVRNINSRGSTKNFIFHTVSKVNFINCLSVSRTENTWLHTQIIEMCSFAIELSGMQNLIFVIPMATQYFYLTSITLSGDRCENINATDRMFYCCEIHFDNLSVITTSKVDPALLYMGTYINCYFSGKIKFSGPATIGWLVWANRIAFTNCCLLFEFENVTNTVISSKDFFSCTMQGTSINDKELLGFEVNGGNNLINLTTAQCKDPAHLREIGLPEKPESTTTEVT